VYVVPVARSRSHDGFLVSGTPTTAVMGRVPAGARPAVDSADGVVAARTPVRPVGPPRDTDVVRRPRGPLPSGGGSCPSCARSSTRTPPPGTAVFSGTAARQATRTGSVSRSARRTPRPRSRRGTAEAIRLGDHAPQIPSVVFVREDGELVESHPSGWSTASGAPLPGEPLPSLPGRVHVPAPARPRTRCGPPTGGARSPSGASTHDPCSPPALLTMPSFLRGARAPWRSAFRERTMRGQASNGGRERTSHDYLQP
jgi:hypothetical protein